jgi:hypothetical protein
LSWFVLLLWLIGGIALLDGSSPELIHEEQPMDRRTLGCAMDLVPAGENAIGLSFQIENRSDQPVTVRYFQPFIGFDLSASAVDGDISVIQPRFDPPVQPVTLALSPGEETRIETPITLAFDPAAPPAGGDNPTRWLFRHDPIPVRLQATLRLDGAEVSPCENRWDPED